MFRGEKTFVKRAARRIVALLSILVFVLTAFLPPVVQTQAKSQFTIKASVGFDGKIRGNTSAPVSVEVFNTGDNFEGRLQVIVPDAERNIMYEKDINIPASSKKEFSISVPFTIYTSYITVRIVTPKEKVLLNEQVDVQFERNISTINMGVLSDDWPALSYVNGINLYTSGYYYSNQEVKTSFLGLNATSFPNDAESLNMLDILLISNFSTDSLASDQLAALDKWIQQGGLLLIGSGSTYTKVFSGLRNLGFMEHFNSSAVDFQKVKTTYGLDTADSFYTTVGDLYINNTHDWDQFNNLPISTQTDLSLFIAQYFDQHPVTEEDDIFSDHYLKFCDEHEDYLRKNLADFFGLFGIDDNGWQAYGYKDLIDNLYYYVKTAFLTGWQNALKQDSSIAERPNPVDAEIALIPFVPTSNYPLAAVTKLEADNQSDNSTVTLSQKIQYGLGAVAIVGVDFTQNPLVTYKHKAEVFNYILKYNFDNELRAKIMALQNLANQGYYNSTEYDTYYNVFNALSTASLPPVATYILLLVCYLVGMFVLYKKLKNRKKNIYYWGGQALLALAFSLVIFIFGLTTRMYKPELRTARIRELADGGEKVTDVSVAILPSSKKYQLSLSNDKNYHTVADTRYFWSGGNNTSSEVYSIGINQKPDYKLFTLNNTTPLGTESFIGTNANTGHGTISAEMHNSSNNYYGTFTNNYDTDLDYCFVIFDGRIFLIGSVKKGEEVIIDQNTPNEPAATNYSGYFRTSRKVITSFFTGKDGRVDFGNLFFGKKSTGFQNATTRIAFYEHLRYMQDYTSHMLVAGYTANNLNEKATIDNKFKESTYTLIYRIDPVSDTDAGSIN